MKKKYIIGGFIIFFLTAILIFMIRDDSIRIGVLGYYSSSTTSASIDVYRMVEFAVKQLNEEGSNYIIERYSLNEYDDLDDLSLALSNNGIDIIIGPNTSSEAEPLLGFLHSLEIPVFITTVSSNTFNDQQDNIFRLTDTMNEQVKQLTGAIIDKIDLKAISIYYTEENINFSESFAKLSKDIFNKHAIEVELIKVGELDRIESQELLSKELNTNTVMVIAGPGKAGIITEIISYNNPEVTFFHTSWAKSDTTIEYMQNVDNDIYSLGVKSPSYLDNYNEFINTILVEEKLSFNSYVFGGYEIIYFMDNVIKEVSSYKLEDIQSYIHNLDTYRGQFNIYSFNNAGDGGRGYSLLKVVDHEYSIDIEGLNY